MSDVRGCRRSMVAAAFLVALLGFMPILASGLGLGHLYHDFGGNNDTSGTFDLEVYNGQPVAQSFVVFSPFMLSRIALFMRDLASAPPVNVSIEIRLTDSNNTPEGKILAYSTNRSTGTFSWTNFDLNTSVSLAPGVDYWILAKSTEAQGQGHAWRNPQNNANETGAGALYVPALGSWAILPSWDFSFRLFGWIPTAATLDARATTMTVRAGTETTFRVDLNVAGVDPASDVSFDHWYSAGDLTFVRDSSGTSGLSLNRTESSGHLRYSGSQVPPGAYGYDVTLLVNASVRPGTIESVNVTFRYRDVNRGMYYTLNASASVRVLDVQITLVPGYPQGADPGTTVEYSLDYSVDDRNSTTVRDFRANLTLPQDVSFRNASANSTYDPGSRVVSWALGDLLNGTSGRLTADATVAIGLPARLMLVSNLTVSYRDSDTSRATLLSRLVNVTVTAPVLSVGLAANRTQVRSGDFIEYVLTVSNSGNGVARYVWINDTLDPRLQFRGDRRTVGDLKLDERAVRWSILAMPPGQTSISLDVQTASLLHDTAPINNTVVFGYTDGAGNPRGSGQTPRVTLFGRAPRLKVDFFVDSTAVSPGSRVSERIVVRNVGNEPAYEVVVNQLLDPSTRHESESDGLQPIVARNLLAWHLSMIAPGGQVNLSVVLRSSNAGTADSAVSLHVYGTYTDAYGLDTQEFTSDERRLTVFAPPPWASLGNPAFVLLVASASILALGVGVERAYGRFRVEEVFLVRRDGILLIHRSRSPTMKTDSDAFAAMFTVVQDFIRDTFGYRPGRDLRTLSFGKLGGLIAPGSTTYLMVLHSGRVGVLVRNALAYFVLDIERKRKSELAEWDGNASEIRDIEARLDALIRARAGILIGLFPPRLPSHRPDPTAQGES